MRIATNMIFNQSLYNLSKRSENIFESNETVSSGKRINRPSDDPIDASRVLGYRNMIESIEQFDRNVNSGLAWLRFTEEALGEAEQVFRDAKVLAEQMATGSYDADQREMLVGQAEIIFDQLVKVGNTQILDRYVFSGQKTTTKPFTRDDNYNVQYNGDDRSITVNIQQGIKVTVNTTGQDAFIDDTNTFNILRDLRDALEANDQEMIGAVLPRIDDALTKLSSERAAVGTTMRQMEKTQLVLEDLRLETESLLSVTEDADVIEAVTDLSTQQLAYEAALQSTSMIASLSLVNFL